MTQQNEVDSKLATEVGIDVELVGLLNGKFADVSTKTNIWCFSNELSSYSSTPPSNRLRPLAHSKSRSSTRPPPRNVRCHCFAVIKTVLTPILPDPVATDTQPLRAIRCQLALQHPTDRASLLTMQFKDSNDDDVGLDTKVSTNLDLTLEA